MYLDNISCINFSPYPDEDNFNSNLYNSLYQSINSSLDSPFNENNDILTEPCIFQPFSSFSQISPIQSENTLNKQSLKTNENRNCNHKKLGRKRKNDTSEESEESEERKHTKNDEDNMIRKIKRLLKDALLDIINSEIQEINKNNDIIVVIDDKTYKVKQLLNINQKQIQTISIEENKSLFNKSLEEFFSVDIAGNYDNYPKCYNKAVIEKLKKVENNEKILKIFEITFLESLKYYRKDKDIISKDKYTCLKNLENHFKDLPKTLKDKDKSNTKDYIKQLISLIKNFENFFENKNPRKRRIQH